MNKIPQQNASYLFWPLAVLLFLTLGVFLTTREIPQEQDIRSRAQFLQNPSLFPTEFFEQETSPSLEPTIATDTTRALTVSFSLPGISSLGGNLKPLHPARDITLLLFDPDSNTADPTVEPLFIIESKAQFDDKPESPRYTKFVSTVSLDDKIPANDYQIGLKTNQTILNISKQKDTDLAGILYSLNNATNLHFSNLLVGDIVPTPKGNNRIDVADYNALMNCFESRLESEDCVVQSAADLDDNGVVDGIDYNLLLRSFQSVLARGQPSISPSPTPIKITNMPIATAPPSQAPVSSAGSGLGIVILLGLFALLALGIALAVRKKLPWLPKFGTSELEEKEYYIKKQSEDATGTWVTLTDDNGQTPGYYKGMDVKDGFAHIQGTRKEENGKEFIAITKIFWEEKD